MLGAEPTYLYKISLFARNPAENYFILAKDDIEAVKLLEKVIGKLDISTPTATRVFGYRDVIKVTGEIVILKD